MELPLWTVLPFVLLLLSISLLPLVAAPFWHSHVRRAAVSFGLSLLVIAYLAVRQWQTGDPTMHLLEEALFEYLDFIVLLGSLYVVAGGIVVQGHLRPTPWTNVRFLAVGAVLANVIGTTGASMLLVRPLLRINRPRTHHGHIPLFFIFVVSNTGGLLTPLGDPPLFLGFLRGVEFFWTLSLLPHWVLVNGLLLALFLVWETIAWVREPAETIVHHGERLPLRGLSNLLFLGGIVLAVLLQSEHVAAAVRGLLNPYFPCPNLHLERPWGSVVMGTMALLSLVGTPRGLRQANEFTWEAILEVAVLFVGIFVTMVPALQILKMHGHKLGIDQPSEFLWLTGLMSAFLDNAPTYLTFATIAAGGEDVGGLMTTNPLLLQAISCGAVFFGAMTYIGNGPNFMVRTIAEHSGYRMPSFFGYLLHTCLLLLPIFAVLTWLFF